MQNLKNINYLGVRIDYTVNKRNFESILKKLFQKEGSKIYTINPEFIVDSYFDNNFKKELNSSDLNVIDGVGLLRGIKRHFKKSLTQDEYSSLETFTGVDLTYQILEYANINKLSLVVLGGSKELDIAGKVLKKINENYPNINVICSSSDFTHFEADDEVTLGFIHDHLKFKNLKSVDILLVGYGHKNQEFWIARNSSRIPARVSVGVGGTLDYFSGQVKRAPYWVRKFGFEWLYRLITQPHRFLRIIKATLIFSYLSSYLIQKNSSKK